MRPRKPLSDILHELCENVYFQPPENIKLKYPCIVYTLVGAEKRAADNLGYITHGRYQVLYITRNPDDETIEKLLVLSSIRLDRAYSSDNLHHYSYTMYY